MTVYVDVLLAVNYAVNLLLLMAAGKLLGTTAGRGRLCIAALVGAVGALVIFLPMDGFLLRFLYKGGLSILMTASAFGIRPFGKLARALAAVFVVSFVFAGVMMALQLLMQPGRLFYQNGVVYFHVSALSLVLWTAAAYGAIWLFDRMFLGRTEEKKLFRITVENAGRQVSFDALADTGSTLREPFSGAPVVVCDKALAQRVCPDQPERFRLIPCSTVLGAGMLEGFRPDMVSICGPAGEYKTRDVYIAKSREPIYGEYRAVFNPQLIDGACRPACQQGKECV